MQFVFPSGFDPITNIGGNWSLIAEDVSLPIGEKIDVKGNIQLGSGNTTGASTLYSTGGSGVLGELKMYNANGFSSAAAGVNYYGGLYINLNDASNTKTVSIWKRDADLVE